MYHVAPNNNGGERGRLDVGNGGQGSGVSGFLVEFDLSGVTLNHGDVISAATLRLNCWKYDVDDEVDLDVVAYPLMTNWVEGVGYTDNPGDGSWPFSPTVTGETCYTYQEITNVAPDLTVTSTDKFYGLDTADAGVAWNTPGARGIGTDVHNYLMIDEGIYIDGTISGAEMATLTFTSDGLSVLTNWIGGGMANYGMSFWSTNDAGTYRAALMAREASAPMVLTIMVNRAPPATVLIIR